MGIATVALAAAAGAATGCGNGAKQGGGGLSWAGTPRIFLPRGTPGDRVLIGRVRNDSRDTLHILASRVIVRDAGGTPLRGSAGFTATFAHGLYGAFQRPARLSHAEAVRLGLEVYLPPGRTAPFFAAWHVPPGVRRPLRIDYGAGTLVPPPRETAIVG
jgi:hypothetical protein